MGSYDFGSWEAHFYSHNLWSSPWRALKAFLHVCLWPLPFVTDQPFNPGGVILPTQRFYLGVWRHQFSPQGSPALLYSGSGSHQSYTVPRTTGPDVLGVILHSLWTPQKKGVGPVKSFTNSFTDHLDSQTVFPLSMPLDYRARSHTRTEGLGYKSRPPI